MRLDRDARHSVPQASTLASQNSLTGGRDAGQVLLIASLPSMFCASCATFLAYKERRQWVWFAGFSVLAGVGGFTALNVIGLWRMTGYG